MTSKENIHVTNRDKLVDFLIADLAGPSTRSSFVDFSDLDTNQEEYTFSKKEETWKCFIDSFTGEEVLSITPKRSYSAGIIYPLNSIVEEEGLEDEYSNEDEDALQDSLESSEDQRSNLGDIKDRKRSSRNRNYGDDETEVIKLTNQRKPSSMGISFRFSKTENFFFKISLSGATYQIFKTYRSWPRKGDNEETKRSSKGNPFYKNYYKRIPLNEEIKISNDEIINIEKEGFIEDQTVLHNECKFTVKTYIRKYKESIMATVMVINESGDNENINSLFQSKLEITICDEENNSLLLPLPENVDFESSELKVTEDNIFSFIYQNLKTFAIGHGISVNWKEGDENLSPASVYTEYIPSHDIQPITPDIINSETNKQFEISMEELSKGVGFHKINELLLQYENWIENLESKQDDIEKNNKKFLNIYNHNISLCRESLERMKTGYDILLNDGQENIARKAFLLANEALFLQQEIPTEKREAIFSDDESKRKSFRDKNEWLAELKENNLYNAKGYWRPFQIGFILLTLESIVNPESEYRETVDLLWFPTGGGKTEAYLGISALLLFYTRLNDKENDGVQILMRYTLRLLTAQQFERASKLIVCMEIIRKREELLRDQKEFSIGIWVGGEVTPNTKSQSITNWNEITEEYGQAGKKYKFILQACPWCRAEIGPVPYSRVSELKQDYKAKDRVLGLREKNGLVELHCPDPRCEFKKGLPIYVVDDDIYEKKPSMIISTVDKFARLIWKPNARELFGIDKNGNQKKRPPSLIIQDELHLISNALGSTVGYFETIIEEFCSLEINGNKIKPKIICSTATIRNSKKQILGLYSREKSSIFPPSGIDIGDSFFSKEEKESSGKKFLGVYVPTVSTQQTQANVLSNLIQGPAFLDDDEKDPWWTNLNYFHSIRELGTTWSIYHEDVKRRLILLGERFQIGEKREFKPRDSQISELTSRISSTEVVDAMNKMQLSSSEAGVLRAVLATSIVEVGVDIQRLSLLTILGQPKNTAQYIQVAGRVGRSKAPGLVLTIFGPGRPRDTSHYEKFKSYHQRLYSSVEPTSVTPFSRPAVERYLDGAFFMYLKMKLPSSTFDINVTLEDFPDAEFNQFKQLMILRAKSVNSSKEELEYLTLALDKIENRWFNTNARLWEIDDSQIQNEDKPLLTSQGSYQSSFYDDSFKAPNSMRSVEISSRPMIVDIKRRDKNA